MSDLVSVIIPTYNRFNYLLNTIESVQKQTYNNLQAMQVQIIVINDGSTESEYYSHDWERMGVTIVHLKENSRKKLGFACPGSVARNEGIKYAKGEFIAFCDDDDIWFPKKLSLQLEAMKSTGCQMSCTEGLIGNGPFDFRKKYQKYNSEYYYRTIKHIYQRKGGGQLIVNGYPKMWDSEFIQIHNCIISSSVIIHRKIIDLVGEWKLLKQAVDYDYWKRALKHTNCVYISTPCIYYDKGHGGGRQYNK